MGNEGAELGVSVIPGRDVSRSHVHRWSGGPPAASSGVRWLVVGGALVSVAALAIAVMVGVAPLAASAAVALMVPAAAIDVEHRRLPDAWVLASLAALVAALSVGAIVGSAIQPGATVGGIVGGALCMAMPVLFLHVVSPDAMGFGDVKAAMALGAAVGTIDWRLGAVALCLAALSGAVAGVLGRRRTIAFGPCLVFGAWTVVLAGEPIIGALFTGASP